MQLVYIVLHLCKTLVGDVNALAISCSRFLVYSITLLSLSTLVSPCRAWSWSLWEAEVPLPVAHKDNIEIICKATDNAYNTQPDSVAGVWNLRGVLNNAWHRVQIEVEE